MSKPLGISYNMRLCIPSIVEDEIWNAVETAIINGWTAEQFKMEVAQAWVETLNQQGEHARKVFNDG